MIITSTLLRGGRITSTEDDVVKFISSIQSDQRLLKSVIMINQAHIIMLLEQKIVDWPEGSKILFALSELAKKRKLLSTNIIEDVHMAIEEEVINRVGPRIGGNLHIAKSRNDQVSTAIRMELRQNLVKLITLLIKLQETLMTLAEKHIETVIPGYTHLRPAQPITFAHYLLSHVDVFQRSLHRLNENYTRVNLSPMGAGALATSSFPIDRNRVATLLGFQDLQENSLDAVNSRDFVLETLAHLTIIAIDLSRFVEDLIIWSTPEFNLIELPDRFTSTSSIMPQKKNPDVLEVIRAKAGHVTGNLVATATTLKALPSSYNLDLQEITPRLWESLDEVIGSLEMFIQLLPNLKVRRTPFNKPYLSYLASTEIANMLVRKYGVPFRTAHKIVGSLIKRLLKMKLTPAEVTAEMLQKVVRNATSRSLNIKIGDIRRCTEVSKLVETYNVRGSPSPKEVDRMLKTRKNRISVSKSKLSEKRSQLREMEKRLQSLGKSYSTLKPSEHHKI